MFRNGELIIDNFAGGGGASTGIESAFKEIYVDFAANHDPDAIRMHKANHPKTIHMQEDIWLVDPLSVTKGRPVGLLWQSPDCFPAGNLVWTSKGYVPIEEVRPFDIVTTHEGNEKMVTRFIKKNDRKFANIKISGCEEFQATLNHPFYVRRKRIKKVNGVAKTVLCDPEWVKAEDLTPDYKVAIPINTKSVIPIWNGCIRTTANPYGITNAWIENSLSKYMDNSDFWWIVGRYFGDGSITKDIVDICCSFDRSFEIKEKAEALGLKYTERDKKETHSFLWNNKEFCEFLRQFGIGSANKSITPAILDLPKSLLRCFLDGYIGADGCYVKTNTNNILYTTTVSKKLAYGLQQCFLKAYGVYGTMYKEHNRDIIQGRKVNCHDVYSVNFHMNKNERTQYVIEENVAWVNIRKVNIVNDVQKSVYCLSVMDDESFTINNVAVHNCTHFSNTAGKRPLSHHIRGLAWNALKWAATVHPRVIIMENVPEFMNWGPLNRGKHGYYDENGQKQFRSGHRPIEAKKGVTFKQFCKQLNELGYEVDYRTLCAADYGAATIRERFFLIARCDGKPIEWPKVTHAERHSEAVKNGTLKAYTPATSIINYCVSGGSVFEKRNGKCRYGEKAMNRIYTCIEKYIINEPNPNILPVCSPDYDLEIGLITEEYGTSNGFDPYSPMHTITKTAGAHFKDIRVCLKKATVENFKGLGPDSRKIAEDMQERFGPVWIDDSFYFIIDILGRNLMPNEMYKAQGFPENYIIDRDAEGKVYSKTAQNARVGNSVVPLMAKLLVQNNFPEFKSA